MLKHLCCAFNHTQCKVWVAQILCHIKYKFVVYPIRFSSSAYTVIASTCLQTCFCSVLLSTCGPI